MARWRFYQGLRTEWRWYHFDDAGQLIGESDQGFAELRGCMANAETAGFVDGEAFQVHTRQAGALTDHLEVPVEGPEDLAAAGLERAGSDQQPST